MPVYWGRSAWSTTGKAMGLLTLVEGWKVGGCGCLKERLLVGDRGEQLARQPRLGEHVCNNASERQVELAHVSREGK